MAISKGKAVGGLAGILLLAVALGAAYTWVTLNWSYSKGERAGYVQKFSTKGWLFKTWEGELQMIPIPGAVPEKFPFSVRDEQVVRKINASMGKKVSLAYEQHKGVPSKIFAETEYFVTDVRPLE